VGGLVGYKYNGTATNSFWDIDASGQSGSVLGTGKSTSDMKMQSTYTSWDFGSTWSIQDDFNDGYPYLQWQTVPVVYPMPVSDWAIYAGIMLILAFTVFRFRKVLV
jgi:hypothetical protein